MRFTVSKARSFRVWRLTASVIAACVVAVPALADPPDEADEPPTLDELLGLEEEEEEGRQTADVAGAEAELQRRLSQREMRNAFTAALEKMTLSADLLQMELDPRAATQRVQEEILIKLDQLIDEARKQCGGSCSSSSRSTSTTPPGQKPGASAKPGQRAGSRAGGAGGAEPPLKQGDLNTLLEETGREWGDLPQRVREMLLQGRSEEFCTLYERLTREYYRRLAEENSS